MTAPESAHSSEPGQVTDSAAGHRHLPPPEDVIAQAIRKADGKHDMGAGALGEVAVAALREAGYRLMQSVCEVCDDYA